MHCIDCTPGTCVQANTLDSSTSAFEMLMHWATFEAIIMHACMLCQQIKKMRAIILNNA